MGEYAIVTGGSRGIGKWCALQCAKEGYDVVINYTSDRGAKAAEETKKEIEALGVKVIAVRGDVSKYEDCKKIVDEAVATFGKDVAVLVNNAGISVGRDFTEVDIEQIERVISVNLLSQLYCARLVYPMMVARKKGWIINIASNSGIMGVEGYVDYSASKGGSIALTKALAKEAAHHGIKVNCIAPGCFASDMVMDAPQENIDFVTQSAPLKCLGDEAEMQRVVHYLITTTFTTGQVISPNGGWTI